MKKSEIEQKNKKNLNNELNKSKNTKKEVAKLEEEVVKVEEVSNKKSKKKIKVNDLILVVGLVAVIVLGCFVMGGEKVEPSYELPLQLNGEAGLQQLTYKEYQEKVDNDESFVVIVERATCSHCVTYLPIAEDFADENQLPMYYVDTDTFTSEDWAGFEKSNTFLKKNAGNWGTPTTIVLAGREAVDYIEGTTDEDSLLELYNEYFNIKE